MKSVDFYYDYGSPAAYLAWSQLPALCTRLGARLVYHPVLLGGIFKATGNASPVEIEAKGRWLFDDLARFADRYGVPFHKNPHFIVNTLTIMRGAIWAQTAGCLETYNAAIFKAMWSDQRNMADLGEIAAVSEAAGLDPKTLIAATQAKGVKQSLIDAGSRAVERGVFGVPTFFIGDDMHFGQDRLDWVADALRKT